MATTLLDGPATPVETAQLQRWPASPRLSRGELTCAALAAVLLALLTTWPLVLHIGSRISPDLGDPVRTAWQLAWVGHALLHSPGHLFDSNAFYPRPLSLAFSDSLLGYAPAGFLGAGTVAALVRYNLLFLLAWSLSFLGAYLLGRELGLGRLGGAAAGIAFAYAPYRVTEAGHLHVISSGGIPLALFLLLRGYRRARPGAASLANSGSDAPAPPENRRLTPARSALWLIASGWLVAAWQISLGFTLGLQFAYLLAVLAVLAALHWWRAERPALPRRLVAVTLAGIAFVGAVTVLQARPYLQVAHDYPTARRSVKEVERYSTGPVAFLAASSENRVWGSITASARAQVSSKNENVFFPGLAILALALLGLAVGPYTRRLRIGLAVGVLTCSVLALGLGLTGAGYPYRLLFDHAPGWDGVRVPGRLFTTATLLLALLAGAGAQWLVRWARVRGALVSPFWRDRLPLLVGGVLLFGLLGEGAGHLGHPLVPQPAPAEIGLPGPILDLPTDGADDRIWQYFSTDGFPRLVQGNSTFEIPALVDLRGGMNGFPDRASVEKLRWWGIRTVVLHLHPAKLPPLHEEVPEPPDPVAAAAKPIAGLGVTRRRVGEVVIYTVGPGPKALHGSA